MDYSIVVKIFLFCGLTAIGIILLDMLIVDVNWESVKKFFRIDKSYKFEYNDLRCFITVINVILIMVYGLSISWFGLFVALIGIVKDLTIDRKINGLLMHLSNVVLNIYFLILYYKG